MHLPIYVHISLHVLSDRLQQYGRFCTDLLHSNRDCNLPESGQGKERIYSDQFIRIEQPDKVLTGYGFESNQQMTEYQIFNNTGIFTVEDTTPADTTKN